MVVTTSGAHMRGHSGTQPPQWHRLGKAARTGPAWQWFCVGTASRWQPDRHQRCARDTDLSVVSLASATGAELATPSHGMAVWTVRGAAVALVQVQVR